MASTVTTHTHTQVKLSVVCPPTGSTTRAARRLTRVCGRDDGAKEKAVGVVEPVGQLSRQIHQSDHAVHQVPAVKHGRASSSRTQGTHGEHQQKGETHPIIKQEMAVPRKA